MVQKRRLSVLFRGYRLDQMIGLLWTWRWGSWIENSDLSGAVEPQQSTESTLKLTVKGGVFGQRGLSVLFRGYRLDQMA
jgi:hypothetical protein